MKTSMTNQRDIEDDDEEEKPILDLVTNGIITRCDSDIGLCWDIKDQIYARRGILPRDLKPIPQRKRFYLTYLSTVYQAPFMGGYSITKYFLPNGELIYSNKCAQGHGACKHAETLKVVELFNMYSSQEYRKKKSTKPKPKRKIVKKKKCGCK